jgi:hypothetical protein
MSLKFRHFVSNCDFNRHNVAVFEDTENDDLRILSAQKDQEEILRRTVTRDEYSNLQDQWSENGRLHDGDARITRSALIYLGVI